MLNNNTQIGQNIESVFNDIIVSFSLKLDGNMSFSHGDTSNTLPDRKKFLRILGINHEDLVSSEQVHKSDIYYADESDRGKGAISNNNRLIGFDAIMTDRADVPIAVFTADCLSLFLLDKKTKAIAVVHAGWRSTKDNIAVKTIESMKKRFGTVPSNIFTWLGPSIRSCSYEVGNEMRDIFPGFILEKNNKLYLDLAGVNIAQLKDMGVSDDNIFDPKICTYCQSDEFFSYRKEGRDCGRMMSVMMIKGST